MHSMFFGDNKDHGKGFVLASIFAAIPDWNLHVEPKNRRWLFNLTYRSADGREKQSTGTSIPDQIMDQFLQAHMTDGECFAELKVGTRKRGDSIILLKRRIGEQTSANSWSTSSKPQPGFVVWLEEWK